MRDELRSDIRAQKEGMMRQVVYSAAMSLDGYIASPKGDHDWIVMDPDLDFVEHMRRFDTFLYGRKTFETVLRMGSDLNSTPGTQNIVFSRTLDPSNYPDVILRSDAEHVVRGLRSMPGKDIALFGGGELFRSLLAAGLVDRIEVGVIPVLLGSGVPLLPTADLRANLTLRSQRLYEKTGTVRLEYDVARVCPGGP